MPVTPFQSEIAKILSVNRSPSSYLAGGAALHFEPNSIRYSQDLDYFHDSEKRVLEAFEVDREVLTRHGIDIKQELNHPGYIRVIAKKGEDSTKIEWAHDSAWRFMPVKFYEGRGFCLDPVDLAINKILALAGRDEPRDFLDVMHADEKILAIPALIWAACGKDPGFSPDSLLELLQRKGKYRENDFERLRLNTKIDLFNMKERWLSAMQNSKLVFKRLSPDEVGCLYYDLKGKKFIVPSDTIDESVVPHYATEGGVLPKIEGL